MYQRISGLILAIIIPLLSISDVSAQTKQFNFSLSEMFPIHDYRLSNNNQLVIEVLNENGLVDKSIEGNYTFVINGFIEKVKFKKGVGIIPENFKSSEVFYIKHEKQTGTIRHLYYSISNWVIPIPLWILIVIPVLFIIFAFFIKRILFLLLIVGFILFFLTQGLDFSAFLNMLKEAAFSIGS